MQMACKFVVTESGSGLSGSGSGDEEMVADSHENAAKQALNNNNNSSSSSVLEKQTLNVANDNQKQQQQRKGQENLAMTAQQNRERVKEELRSTVGEDGSGSSEIESGDEESGDEESGESGSGLDEGVRAQLIEDMVKSFAKATIKKTNSSEEVEENNKEVNEEKEESGKEDDEDKDGSNERKEESANLGSEYLKTVTRSVDEMDENVALKDADENEVSFIVCALSNDKSSFWFIKMR